MQETWVQSPDQEDPLEKRIATHSNILAWRIPKTEGPGGLQSTGLQRVGHDWSNFSSVQFGRSVLSNSLQPMDCSMSGFPVHHQLLELAQTHVHRVAVMPSNRLILCHPLHLLPSIFPSIRVWYDNVPQYNLSHSLCCVLGGSFLPGNFM